MRPPRVLAGAGEERARCGIRSVLVGFVWVGFSGALWVFRVFFVVFLGLGCLRGFWWLLLHLRGPFVLFHGF